MTRIELPWPAKELSPNAREGWWTVAAKKKVARKIAWVSALAAHPPKLDPETPLKVTTTFLPPDRRSYDEDNLKARMKASYDGIADALRVDDKYFRHAPISIGEPVKHGAVQITIEVA